MPWVHVIKPYNCTLHWVYTCCFEVSILFSGLHVRELVVYLLSTLFFPCFLPLHDHLNFSLSVSTHLQPHRCKLFQSLVMSTVPPASRYVCGPLKATGVFPGSLLYLLLSTPNSARLITWNQVCKHTQRKEMVKYCTLEQYQCNVKSIVLQNCINLWLRMGGGCWLLHLKFPLCFKDDKEQQQPQHY